jgi:hypothetical protein
MGRNVTVTFADGTSHVYNGTPDNITPDLVQARAEKEFGKKVTALDGGAKSTETTIKAPVVNVGRQPDAIPERDMMQKYGYPVLETVLPLAGGIVGAVPGVVGGPAGVALGDAAGAGVGYAAAKQLERLYEEQTRKAKPKTLAESSGDITRDIAEGAMLGLGGRLILGPAAKALGWIWDAASGKLIQVKAGQIVRELAGDQVNAVRNAAASAPANLTAGQAVANVRAPAIQTLQSRMAQRDPNLTIGAEQEYAANLNQLQALAGGSTQTAAKNAQKEAKNALNARLIPTLTTELNAANIAGQQLPKLQGEADRFAQAATNKVEDVRRFTAAGERAGERAANTVPVLGQPRVPGRYTYMGELEKKAEVEAAKAAEGFLAFGEAAKFKQQGVDSLAAYGLKPLKSDAIIAKLSTKVKDRSHAGNDLIEGSIESVMDDVAKWTDNNGVIDAWAADSIRKNSVSAAIQRLRPNMDQTAQKNEAAKILGHVKNVFEDAIEEAGGTGYRKYLADYSAGRQAIDQTKLSAKALQLYKESPDKFIALVEGNSPKEVEKVFGPGSYNIAKEMSYEAFLKLKGISSTLQRNQAMAKQAGAGEGGGAEKYANTIRKETGLFRIPNILSPKVAITNEGLSLLEGKINDKLMLELEKGVQSGKSLAKLIDTLPASDRNLVLRLLKSKTGSRGTTFGVNALVGDENFDSAAYNNRNALAQ